MGVCQAPFAPRKDSFVNFYEINLVKENYMKNTITDINQIPLLFDVNMLADVMRVSKPTAYRLIEREEIPVYRSVSRIVIRKKDFLKWFDNRFGNPA